MYHAKCIWELIYENVKIFMSTLMLESYHGLQQIYIRRGIYCHSYT